VRQLSVCLCVSVWRGNGKEERVLLTYLLTVNGDIPLPRLCVRAFFLQSFYLFISRSEGLQDAPGIWHLGAFGAAQSRTVRPQSFRPPSSNRTMVYDKKTKIFCTMGPACWDVPTITTLIDAGMNTARLNFSHGDHAAHGATMDRVKEAAALRPGAPR
jgi:hypothetical protein